MNSKTIPSLTLAIIAVLGLSGAAFAQSTQATGTTTTQSGQMADPDSTEAATAGAAQAEASVAPSPEIPPTLPVTGTVAIGSGVTVTSHPGDSVSSNYDIDFDAMDTNHDGFITRAEAKGNPDLMREFRVVDRNHNGRLTKEELEGWLK